MRTRKLRGPKVSPKRTEREMAFLAYLGLLTIFRAQNIPNNTMLDIVCVRERMFLPNIHEKLLITLLRLLG